MKGITPVLSVILLLLISIAMIGFAATWFFRTSETWENRTQNDMDFRLRSMATKARIEAINNTAGYLIIRNTGTVSLYKNEVTVYVDDVLISCPSVAEWSATTPPGSTAKCTNTQIKSCGKIKVTTIGWADIATC
jgi:FlaG/FlaF family flagellin (archaellin)